MQMKIIPKINKEEIPCVGLFFKATINTFISSYNSVEVKKSLRLLKRMSCKGCKECENHLKFLKEGVEETTIPDDYLSNIKNGKIYRLDISFVNNDSLDDTDIDVNFIEVIEQ